MKHAPPIAWQFRRPAGCWIRVCDAVLRPAERLLHGVSNDKGVSPSLTASGKAAEPSATNARPA